MASLIAYGFWNNVCGDTLASCVADGPVLGPVSFLLISIFRPFVFTPVAFVAVLGGKVFGPVLGAFLTALGSLGACVIVYGIAKLAGKRLAKPWLRSNLPATLTFIRSQDYKVVLATRLIPIIPFDLMSLLFGALDFRIKSVMFASFFGVLPEAYMYAKLVDPNESLIASTVTTLGVLAVCVIVPLIIFEWIGRGRGTGLWQLFKNMNREILYEVRANNDIVKRHQFDKEKTPVLLLYGFFSSRRAVTVLERMLTARGFQVMSFNLGGLLGTFFTRGILETATFIDYKIKRQIERHGFTKIHIVCHSKGGLVALWWALKLGGSQYCDRIITIGTPFRGSRLTYLALVTPLGLFWRDVWQMRPGSMFLKSLHDVHIPEHMKIYCLHSERDRIATGHKGIFVPRHPSPNIHPVAMHHLSHFEFLYRRDVGDTIAQILRNGTDQDSKKQELTAV